MRGGYTHSQPIPQIALFRIMNNPIVEKLRNQIQDYRTSEYFKEVLSCYYSSNLRSAVVMLYATVICDLIYKLEQLSSEFGDTGAKQILDEIEAQWEANPTSPDWETALPKKCLATHKVLDTASHSNFESLQKLRHLCAHPAMKGNRELYQPTSEIVLGHIMNMLDEVLTRSALMTKDFIKVFVKDVASVKDQMVNTEKLKMYIKARYFDKYDDAALFYNLFKALWKFVFYLDNDDCEENREVNFNALLILADSYGVQFMPRFEKDSGTIANTIKIDDDKFLRLYIKFVNTFPNFYTALSEDSRIKIESAVTSSEDLKALGIFLSGNPLEHIRNSKPQYRDTILYLSEYLKNNISKAESLDFNIEQYGGSGSYDQADWRFDSLILPYLKEFTFEQMKRIMEYSNNNGQIYARHRAGTSNRTIKNRIIQMDEHFDFSAFRIFKTL